METRNIDSEPVGAAGSTEDRAPPNEASAKPVKLDSKAAEVGAVLAVFPELGLSAYSIPIIVGYPSARVPQSLARRPNSRWSDGSSHKPSPG